MKSSVKSKGAVKAARRDNAFKLLTSTAMIAMALGSASAIAGPGRVCLDGVTPLASCGAGTIGTYYANSPKLRKFVDTLPGLTPAGKNTFAKDGSGTYISVAIPDVTSYPGSEYFIIGVVEYQQRMHSDLQKPTTLRGYVQLYPQGAVVNGVAKSTPVDSLTGQVLPAPYALQYPDKTPITWPGTTEQVYAYDKPNYLGPIILTPSGTPVRTKMVNLLPLGRATVLAGGVVSRNGDMFLPVDESLGGAGIAPTATGAPAEKYPQNRVSFHLHGGDTPWISDGTPHQWITPAGDTSNFKTGNRMFNVPDMPFPGEGALTLYWPNDQSARLMWFHDHSFGLTRQNAYAGNAAGYVIYDNTELALQGGVSGTDPSFAASGINKALPNALFDQILLVIQDKTFVPTDIAVQDSKWDTQRWGQPGDLWFPHVYEPFQLWGATAPAIETDPANVGVNPAGRWDYAVNDIGGTYLPPKVRTRMDPEYGEVAFPDGSYGGASTTPEAYMDTPVINGVAYPTMTVEPKAYRVRFLNGANDRYFNLSLWVADPTQPTEIVTVPLGGVDSAGNPNPSPDAAGIPDPATAGPNIILFANEAGFLPKPVVYKPTLMPYVVADEIGIDPTNFYLGSAERADTVIDFSQYAGKTLILYNDGAAPVPGGDPRYDYYTGNPDQSLGGGAPSTQPGFGPNTRTMMQIVVKDVAPAAPYDPNGTGGPLATELPKAYAATAEQHVDVAATPTTPAIAAMPLSLDPVTAKLTLSDGSSVPLQIKTIHGLNDPNIGRLVAQLGTELPITPADPTVRVATPLSYIDVPTEIISQDEVQYWWIRNYDVDNHPMHFHLFNVQVLAHYDPANNSMRPPTDDELGWKETVKNWPMEDLLVAMKPKTPQLPFGLPNSVRTLDPTMHDGATANDVLYGTHTTDGSTTPFAFAQLELDATSPNYGQSKAVSNTTMDYGWEYVWHCHILGHEENDLMRPMVYLPVIAAPAVPTGVTVSPNGLVQWTDPTPANTAKGNSSNEFGFRVERAEVSSVNGVATPGAFVALPALSPVMDKANRVNTLANEVSYQDKPVAGINYQYQVVAVNEAAPATSAATDLVQALAPTALNVAAAPVATARTLTLKWTDNANNELGYFVESSTDNGATWKPVGAVAANVTTLAVTGLLPFTTYQFRVGSAKIDSITGAASATGYTAGYASVIHTTPAELLAPVVTAKSTTNAAGLPQALVTWTDTSTGETAYAVERCTGTTTACNAAAAPWTVLSNTLAAGTVSHTDSTVVAGTTYVYRVKALGGATVGPVGKSAQVLAAVSVNAPTNLVASSAAGADVVLKWNDASTNETSYKVLRSTAGANTFAVIGTVASAAAQKALTTAIATYTDKTVVSGVSYDYQVIAVNTNGTTVSDSVPSNTATISPVVPAPTALTATTTTGKMVLTWVDKSTNETSFRVARTETGTGTTVLLTAPAKAGSGTTVTYTDATAVPLVSYTYTVAAVTSAAAVVPAVTGAVSTPVAGQVNLAAPGVATAAMTNATRITVTWTDLANNETGFIVERAINGVWAALPAVAGQIYTAKANVLTYTDNLVAPVTQGSYQYRVKAISATGTGVAAVVKASSTATVSNVLDFTAPASAPAGVQQLASAKGTLKVGWNPLVGSQTGFTIQRSTTAAFTTVNATAVAGAGAVTGTITGQTSGKSFYVRVAATNALGTSTYSPAVLMLVP